MKSSTNSLSKNQLAFKMNVFVFASVGAIYFLYLCVTLPAIPNINPISALGVEGIYIAIFGGTLSLMFYRFGEFRFYRTLGISIVVFLVLFFSLFIAGGNLEGQNLALFFLTWMGVLTVLYFMLIGLVNAVFGRWIAFFNLIIAVMAVSQTDSVNPLIWTNILSVVGIEHPVFQWFVVLISVLLGFSDKGFGLLSSPQ